jgi:hypothetical protein
MFMVILSEDEHETKGPHDHASYCENQYKRMCSMLNIIPVSSFIRELSTKRVSVRHRSLCSKGAKAIAVALLVSIVYILFICLFVCLFYGA